MWRFLILYTEGRAEFDSRRWKNPNLHTKMTSSYHLDGRACLRPPLLNVWWIAARVIYSNLCWAVHWFQ